MTRVITILAICAIAIATMGAGSCKGEASSDAVQREQTEKMAAEASRQTGMPGITNFTERKFVKYLYELRDREGYGTYTYIVDLNGGLHFVCESVGFGIPYSAQYVNPEKTVFAYSQGGHGTLPQPEPNGLFVPDGLSATWVLCSNEGKVQPVYVEPQIMVSPFPLEAKSNY